MLRFPILRENKIFAPGKGIQDAQVNCFYNIMGYNFNYNCKQKNALMVECSFTN